MPLVLPEEVSNRLGRDLTEAEARQVPLWIGDAELAIETRKALLGVQHVDQRMMELVAVKAVVAMARRPDDATRVDIAVDDGRVGRTYTSGTGEVTITDEWWAELGLSLPADSGWSGSVAYRRQ